MKCPRPMSLILVSLFCVFGIWLDGCSKSTSIDVRSPEIVVTPTSLDFSARALGNPPQQKLLVKNVGGGNLSFTATNSSSWLTLNPILIDTIFVNVLSESLEPGTYYDTIEIIDPDAVNSPQYVPVTLEVRNALTVVSDSLHFMAASGGANPDSQYIRISGVAGGQIHFDLASAAGWLTLSHVSGQTPDSIQIDADITGLPTGIHRDSVVITSPDLPSERVVVTCVLVINSWELRNSGVLASVNLRGVAFRNSQAGWISGVIPSTTEVGTVYKTVNGGESWTLALRSDYRS
ncbi:MAG: hypothetical protein KKA42_09225, partial [candidate division Zixibacteria bacterium]|nr:hypothetical protein [candidate division Zixibacteria bacterium]